MLFAYLGPPCSGKTTAAAKVFAELKDSGQPTEYIAEVARTYIAKRRYHLPAGTPVVLTDADQFSIAQSQFDSERYLNDPNTMVVTDSCVLNALLYMTEEARKYDNVVELAKRATAQYDIIFLCAPVPRPLTHDLNRVHDEETSLKIYNQIETIIEPYLSNTDPNVKTPKLIHLSGSPRFRMNQSMSDILNAFIQRS